jgi:hypothetical protein
MTSEPRGDENDPVTHSVAPVKYGTLPHYWEGGHCAYCGMASDDRGRNGKCPNRPTGSEEDDRKAAQS